MPLPRRLPILFALLMLALPLFGGRPSSLAAQRLPGDPEPLGEVAVPVERIAADLTRLVQTSGSIRVIAGLRLPAGAAWQPEGTLASAQAESTQRAAIRGAQDTLEQRLPAAARGGVRFETIPAVALTVDSAGLAALNSAPEVAYVYEDRSVRPFVTDSVAMIGTNWVWDAGYSGSGQTVAVIDTGVDSAHPALTGRVVSEACYNNVSGSTTAFSFCPGGGSASTATGSGAACQASTPSCDHGTHVAGIVAGAGSTVRGVAPEANIIAIQVFHGETSGCGSGQTTCTSATWSDVIRGLERVHALRTRFSIAAVNLSLGGGEYTTRAACGQDNPDLKKAIDNLRSRGIVTVAASGNESKADALSAPACLSGVVSVGSSTKTDGVSGFSNSASFLTLLAPGDGITSSVPGGSGAKSGTSMAAPHVAGAWAVLKSKSPDASISTIQSALTSTGKSVLDSGSGITTPRIRLDRAANALGAPSVSKRNDDWADARTVTGNSFTWSQSVWDYTVQAGEPAPPCGNPSSPQGGKSAWFHFVAPANGTLSVNTFTSTYNTVVAVYRTTNSSISGLQPMTNGCNDESGWVPGDSEIKDLPVSIGNTHYIQVTERGGSPVEVATLQFHLFFTAATPPAGCDINWHQPVSGNWTEAGRWTPSRVPNSNDRVCFNASGEYTVRLSSSVTVRDLTTSASNLTLAVGASGADITLTVTGLLKNWATLDLDSAGGAPSNTTIVAGTLENPGTIRSLPPGSGTAGTRTISAPLTLPPVGELEVTQNLVLDKPGAQHSNSGTITLHKSLIVRGAGAKLQNQRGATIRAHDTGLDFDPGTSFGNAGLLELLEAGGEAFLSVYTSVSNSGTIRLSDTAEFGGSAVLGVASSATLTNEAGGTIDVPDSHGGERVFHANVLNRGTITAAAGIFANRARSSFVNAGQITLTNAALVVEEGSFTNQGGRVNGGLLWIMPGAVLAGTGHVGQVLSGGSVRPGTTGPTAAPGELIINGSYLQDLGASLEVDLTGLSTGAPFDKLTVTGSADLAGRLTVKLPANVASSAGANFQVLSAAGVTGAFEQIEIPSIDGNPALTAQHTASGVLLSTATPPPSQVAAIAPLSGGTVTAAYAVNVAGVVAGTSNVSGGETHPIVVQNGTATDLGMIEDGFGAFAYAISSTGQVAGYTQMPNSSFIPWTWENGELTEFAGDTPGFAYGVNSSGDIVGQIIDGPGPHAFHYRDGIRTPLEGLGGPQSRAYAIAAGGMIAGGAWNASNQERAVIWQTSAHPPRELGVLPGGTTSVAHALNESGQAAGWGNSSEGERAIIWTGGRAVNIGALPGHLSSKAYALNNRGQVVGESSFGTTFRAVLWHNGRLIDLNSLLPAGSGWVLERARGINDDGVIAGRGTFNGQQRGFILTLKSSDLPPLLLGGRDLTLTSGGVAGSPGIAVLRWSGGVAQSGYHVTRSSWPSGGDSSLLTATSGPLPGGTTSYVSPLSGSEKDRRFCYTVLTMETPASIDAISDQLCLMPRLSGLSAPENFSLSLNGSTVASLSWLARAGTTRQILAAFDAVTGQNIVTAELAAGVTSLTVETQAKAVCFILIAWNGSTLLGNTDGLCAIPGTGTHGAPAAVAPASTSAAGAAQATQLDLSLVETLTLLSEDGAPSGGAASLGAVVQAMVSQGIQPNRLFTGTVLLQGRTAALPQQGHGIATLTLSGGGGVSYNTADGQVTFAGIADGTYTLTAGAPGYFPASTTVTVTNGSVSGGSLPDLTLRAGMVNGDDRVDITDITALIAAFGSRPVERTDAQGRIVDINGDGVVNILDITLTLSNFGRVGPQSWS